MSQQPVKLTTCGFNSHRPTSTKYMAYKNPDDQRTWQRKAVARRRAEFFSDKSCVTCGSTHELELDHIDPATKIAHSIWSWARDRMNSEIAKCQVLCKVCHKAKTAEEKRQAMTIPLQHGTVSGYYKGCKCSACLLARAAYKRDYYKRSKQNNHTGIA